MHVKGKNLNDLHITTFITNKEIAKSRLHHHKFLFMPFASFFFFSDVIQENRSFGSDYCIIDSVIIKFV